MILIGTSEGVYRAPINELDDASLVLDSERVLRVRRFDDSVYAATSSGLFRSVDGGETWNDLGVPQREVFAVLESPDGERLYAGTHPAHFYVSTDGGESWRERESLLELPSYDTWRTPRHRDEGRVHSLGAHPDAPERVVAGIEVGGVLRSDDNGHAWTEYRDGVHDDVHHVLVVGPAEYIASTGGGLYRTRDAGRSWTRLDDDLDRSYFMEAFAHNGRLYTAGAAPPPAWDGERGPDAVLYESTDGGDSFETVSLPDGIEDSPLVFAWAASDGENNDVFAATYDGHVLTRDAGEWRTVGDVETTIHSIALS